MTSFATRKIRKSFGKIAAAEIPNLIKMQRESYDTFLQQSVATNQRENKGLEYVLRSIFPIADYEGNATLEYVEYELDTPKYDVDECVRRGTNYSAQLRVTLRLIVWEVDEEANIREVRSIKEQDVYMGEVPLMTDRGTFIINGAERVVVSQMHRSPGVFYYHDAGRSHTSGKYLFSARVIPYRGSWLDIEFDIKDLLYFRVDRKRKVYATTLLRALGYGKQEILDYFYSKLSFTYKDGRWIAPFNPQAFRGVRVYQDIVDADTGEVIFATDVKVTPRIIKKLPESDGRYYIVPRDDIIGKFVSHDVVNPKTQEILLESADEITEENLALCEKAAVLTLLVLDVDFIKRGPYMRNTLVVDRNETRQEALAEIYRVLRPGEPSTPDVAEAVFHNLFFNKDRYDLSSIGRMKINAKHNLDFPEDHVILTREDIIAIMKHLVALKDGVGEVDDIDNLANRRVRSVGELVENQYRLGLVRMERSIIERMGSVEIDAVMPHDLINSKMLMSVVREFFGTSQLSQFMDQTNPLAEITHKRRLSALGPGGLTRDRAGHEVRDVHPTHYGRICPIETPEGQNIGLINSLACYARVNKYGFIESPYRRVISGVVTDEISYLSAIEESKYTIVHANAKVDDEGRLSGEMIHCRRNCEIVSASSADIDFIDASPKQLVSVAASLIPFLENDDAGRALMGSNMQRQAVPLIRSEAPFVGTGMEGVVARDSGSSILAKRDGVVVRVDANRIVVKTHEEGSGDAVGVDIYTLVKFKKSNQNTCINQKSIVQVGEEVKRGVIIADGSSTEMGELALGRNLLVGFMSWNGYNFEDSILVSERVVSTDMLTSIHMEEFEVVARDTRLGPEEITRDIPNVSEENLRHLDEIGVVRIGAEVKAGDILVGKVTPKTESPITPEEKLLRAIFGEKAADVRDSSLRVPPGAKGTVVGVNIFVRRGVEKDERAIYLERLEIDRLAKDRDDELEIIHHHSYERAAQLLVGKTIVGGPKTLPVGKEITRDILDQLPRRQVWQILVEDMELVLELTRIKAVLDRCVSEIEERFKKKVEKVQSGDDLPQGALKVVKVYLATKLKIQPGDKMAGRHGNKGVVSKIIPVEDMPFLEDGTPVDIVLNPLGVPSRMNVGQILETHLGLASSCLGKQIDELVRKAKKDHMMEELRQKLLSIYDNKSDSDFYLKMQGMDETSLLQVGSTMTKGVFFATPVFDGAKENEIDRLLELSGAPTNGQMKLIDGRTGIPFDRPITVGYIYMLKLDHLVDDKIHARSIGPYSLVTQQPLGGKSHFGGQRFGEMECWALQAYGAAYTLQEMLTVKSDDITGRIKMYESIVRGDNACESGVPESFNVMIKELRSLCLNIEMQDKQEDK